MLNQAYINLNALCENAVTVKARLNGAKFCAVVKADAYGHGAAQCANALHGIVDCFAVALPEEGRELRLSGIDKPILVLTEPFESDLPLCIRYGLEITVCRPQTVAAAQRAAAQYGEFINAHIKINTGMNRQGADTLKDLEDIMRVIADCPRVNAVGIYSHFRAPQDNFWLKSQLDNFLLAYNAVKGYNNIIPHISASGGLLKGVTLGMCRIGLLLYGYKPFASTKLRLTPVMRVCAPITGRRTLSKGEGLLYGTATLKRRTRVALVRYGYADGLPRQAGRLSAYRCMDVSAYPYTSNDSVTVMSNADKLAREYGTVSYEVLCNAAHRAERIYLR